MGNIRRIDSFVNERKLSRLDMASLSVGQDVYILKIRFDHNRLSRTAELYDKNELTDYLFVKRQVSSVDQFSIKVDFNDERRTYIVINYKRERISTDTRNGGGSDYRLKLHGNTAVYGIDYDNLIVIGVDADSVKSVAEENAALFSKKISDAYYYRIGEYRSCIENMEKNMRSDLENLKELPLFEPRYIPYL